MSVVEMSREEAGALVQRIMDVDYVSDDEVNGWLDQLGKSLMCPTGYVSNLIFWPKEPEPSAAEVVDQALAYQPIAL
ncbi:e9imm peptide [Kitasatospora sp. NPDC004669]|uniref:e9imm peptide n=1 Tax=Kitasatospora sp. NPDC004669 TaxID=3154555 RepID=UPI0033A3EB5B